MVWIKEGPSDEGLSDGEHQDGVDQGPSDGVDEDGVDEWLSDGVDERPSYSVMKGLVMVWMKYE